AHACGPVHPGIVRDMELARHGAEFIHPDPRVFAPTPDGRAIVFYNDAARSAQNIAQLSAKDAQRYPQFQEVLARIGGFLSHVLEFPPPDIDSPSASDIWHLLQTGRGFRGLGRDDMFRVLRWGPMAVADLVAEYFETELLRATIAARGIFGAFLGPWSAGSGTVLLLRAASDPHPAGSSCFVRGGMGKLTEAMAAAAKAAGAEIRTGAEVAQVLVKDGAATGVVLAGGEEIAAKHVVSGADPRRTFLKLLDPAHLAPDFLVKMQHYRAPGTVAKVNLALDALPKFRALAVADGALCGRIHIGPEIDYLERAFDDCKYGSFSRAPYLDVTIPSVTDPTLAPAGKHVMSVHVQFAPYRLKDASWPEQRNALGNVVVKTLAEYAPDLPGLILARQVITPLDLEETYGFTGGHIFHGELALDQLFTMRPLIGWARYRTPIRGLYL
ncbi:MAG: phytoene desaturase family protein, partial [Burkholderiales bacterium]